MAREPVTGHRPDHRPAGHRRQPRHLHADPKEIELAKSELKVSVKAGGIGIGLFAGAAFVAVLAIIMLSVAIAYFIH